MSRLRLACIGALLLLSSPPAAAQDTPPTLPDAAPPPANLTFTDGAVDLIHDGVLDRAAAGVMLLDGDVVRTANGRAEIVFADGSVLHLNHDTELELLSPLRLRLATGRVLVRVSAAATSPYVIDSQSASTRLSPRGEYDVSADRRSERLEVAVVRGSAEIDDGTSATLVRSGEMASILGAGGRVLLQSFNSARFDAFERWSSDRVNGFSTASSSGMLPSELRAYSGYFDSYGRWDYVAPYGNVWYPAVAAAWRPYYSGSWRLTRYGWTWIGYDPWSWPTHHYGRWGFTGAAWYWIPHRAWGPAWVSWAFVPGYVCWSPLGWDNRAVLRWTHRPGDHPAYWPNYDPYRAWTVMPRGAFDGRRPVGTYAVDPAQLPAATRRAMTDIAVPRGTTSGATSAGMVAPSNDFAVPRGTPPSAIPRGTAPPPVGAIPGYGDSPRRGYVRMPRSAPPASVAEQPSAGAPAAPAQPVGAIERRPAPRDSNDDSPGVYQPRVYSPRYEPARPSGEDRPRRDPARAERPRDGGQPSGGEQARPADRSESGRARSGGVAVPRSGSGSSEGASATQGSGQSGAARRRPR